MQQDEVTVVVATRNRGTFAREKAQWALMQPACNEAIFVVDGAEDDTVSLLTELAATDARLKVISLDECVGVPAAKNIGVQNASFQWILLLDDDDRLSDGFLEALLKVAAVSEAEVVGAPWLHLREGEDVATAANRALRHSGGPALDRPQIFPVQDWEECFWLPSNSLINRAVFDKVSFDEGYRGNFYREETDFFVSAARAGFRVVVTGLAYSYLEKRSGGGIERGSKAEYEYWVLRNNWRFMQKHGVWLREVGAIRGPIQHQVALCERRFRPIARAVGRRLLRRTRP